MISVFGIRGRLVKPCNDSVLWLCGQGRAINPPVIGIGTPVVVG
jgi:hypothetical protein